MAHELTQRANGFVEMAYLGDKPWHNLGQELAKTVIVDVNGQQIERAPTIAEWQTAAGMDWRIQRSKVRYFASRDGNEQLELPDQHVLFRSDTHAPLGIVSDKYKVVQPAQVLEFFRDLTEGAGFEMSTAGTLFGGKKMWALAKIPDAIAQVVAGDKVGGYLLLASSCDGSSATIGKFVMERTVCNNTLTIGLAEKGSSVKMSHRAAFDAAAMKAKLGIAQDGFESLVDDMRDLTQIDISTPRAELFVRNLLRPEDVAATPNTGAQTLAELLNRPLSMSAIDTEKRAPRGEADILRLFAGAAKGDRLPGVHGTAYGLLNAVTEYVDHHASTKSDSHRMQSAWFNGGDELKTTALQQLLAMR